MMDFDEWFDANGYAENHRYMFRIVWEAAQAELLKDQNLPPLGNDFYCAMLDKSAGKS